MKYILNTAGQDLKGDYKIVIFPDAVATQLQPNVKLSAAIINLETLTELYNQLDELKGRLSGYDPIMMIETKDNPVPCIVVCNPPEKTDSMDELTRILNIFTTRSSYGYQLFDLNKKEDAVCDRV